MPEGFDGEMQEIIRDFVAESRETLDGLDRKFLELGKNPEDPELLNAIFRAVHTIKGAAGFLGLNQLVEVAHKAENVMGKLRQKELVLTEEIVAALLSGVDIIKLLLGHVDAGDGVQEDISATVRELEGCLVPKDDLTPETERSGGETAAAAQLPAAAVGKKAASPGEQTVRVDIKRLDGVMDLVGEMVLGRNRLLKLMERLDEKYPEDELTESFGATFSFIDLVTSDLQLAVMKTRMQPLRKVFNRFPRMAWDLAKSRGKEVDLQVIGEDTELDKSVIDEIGEPLVHLLRNSVDHGIEPPGERIAAVKPGAGALRLYAGYENNNVVIILEDDGRGIDVEAVREKAVQKGVLALAEAERLSEKETLELIFLPGLSTAKKVDDVSGRGVGLDVVKTSINRLKGIVQVETRKGKGTKFTIRLPFTVAILQALIVKAGSETYAVPLSAITEIIRISPGDIRPLNGGEVIIRRDKTVTVLRLESEFGYEPSNSGDRQYVVVLSMMEGSVGLLVDGLVGQEEVVIKPIGDTGSRAKGLAGVTITGDGRVILILDVEMLIKSKAGQPGALAS